MNCLHLKKKHIPFSLTSHKEYCYPSKTLCHPVKQNNNRLEKKFQ